MFRRMECCFLNVYYLNLQIMECTLYALMTETILGDIILWIGVIMGILAAYSCSWHEARKMKILSYRDFPIQVINRILFTLGCILCLFLDFPSRADWVGKEINFIIFPFIGCCCLCLTWCISYNLSRIAVQVYDWWLDN